MYWFMFRIKMYRFMQQCTGLWWRCTGLQVIEEDEERFTEEELDAMAKLVDSTLPAPPEWKKQKKYDKKVKKNW